jgi:NTE family protein
MQVPVAYPGGHLIDGGITSLVPVRFARAMGAHVVVAVDIYCQSPRATAVNVPAVLGKVMQSQSCLIAAPEMAEADVLVAPVVAVPGMSDRASQEQAIEAGYRATHAALAKWRSGTMIEQRSARFENSMTLKEVGSHENGGFVVGSSGGGFPRGPSTGRRRAGPGSEAGSHFGCGCSRCSHQAPGRARV